MSTFVLVHGGLSTGAIWDKIVPALKKAGHVVYTPDLKGMGSRIAELSPNISIDDYVADVCEVIKKNNLHQVILVGHSLAGLVITAVASQLPGRIVELVYLDALIPEVGDSVFSLCAPDLIEWILNLAKEGGDGWRYMPEQLVNEDSFPNKEIRERMLPRLSPQPIHAQETSVQFDPLMVDKISKYFIFCTEDGAFTAASAEKAKRLSWRYDEINTGHMVMVTAPKELIHLLLKLAKEIN